MIVKPINNYYTDENTYLVYDEKTREGFIIDPGINADKIKGAAMAENVRIRYILITHCHYDHIEFLEELREMTGALLVSGDKASINITDPAINLTYSGLGRSISAKKSDIVLEDGGELSVASVKIKCIYTPGHTNCSVCFLAGDSLFSGDTVFLRNVGRWDLPTGDGAALIRSIKEKIYTLDDEIKIYPGHGGETSVGYEKKFNLYVRADGGREDELY